MKLDVCEDGEDNKIGEVEITVQHEIVDSTEGKYIVASAYAIAVLKWTG